MTIFHDFIPPFDESRPVPRQNMTVTDEAGTPLPTSVLDRDDATVWNAATGLVRGSGITVRVDPPRRLSALVLGVAIDQSPLGVSWVATLGGRIVAHPERFALQWVGGVPRAGKQALMTIVLPS